MTHYEISYVKGSIYPTEVFDTPPWRVLYEPEGLSAARDDLKVFIPWTFIRRVEEWDE